MSKFHPVTCPKGYNSHPTGVQCIEIVEHFNFNVGNAMKYLWRNGLKPGASAIEDLRKAAWYATREADRLSKEASTSRKSGRRGTRK